MTSGHSRSRRWSEIADQAAEGGADGLMEMFRRLDAGAD